MSTREALLAAIVASPDDDTPRLVYADFLDETGDADDAARATLIRTQIAAARLPPGEERESLDRVALGLWEKHKFAWFRGVSPSKLSFPSRGFITDWGCFSVDEFTGTSSVPFGREPIHDLLLSLDRAIDLAGAEAWQGLSLIRELRVWPGSTDDEGLVPFFSSPHLTGLRKIEIMGRRSRPWGAMSETARVLAKLWQYASLQELATQHAEFGDAGAIALANSSTLRGLTTLALPQCGIGIGGIRALLASPVLSTVKHLGFGGNVLTATEGEALAEALAASKHLSRLESLWLDETAFTDRAAELLARGEWSSLKRLAIYPHAWGHSGEATGLPTLTARGVETIVARSPNLETLELDGQPIGDAGAMAIASDNRLKHLKRLSLFSVGLTAAGVQQLVAAYSRHLHYFQLASNVIGDAGASAIAKADWPAMLRDPLGDYRKPIPFYYEQRGIYLVLQP